MDIKPFDRTIRSLLESGFYRIPRFQRPYSWERPHVEEFWEDIVGFDDQDYFIGSLVVYPDKKDSNTLLVVDGQQRLTTITLFLAALRETLKKYELVNLAEGIQSLIETKDIDNEPTFILQTETSYPYLQEYIQKYEEPEVEASIGPEEKALSQAYSLLENRVASIAKSVELDSTISDENKAEIIESKLRAVRDKVLSLQVIVIRLGNEDDAYQIFETLNTRGKDLGISDLIKNHLTRLLRPKTKGVDTTKDRWDSLRQTIQGGATAIDFDRFIYHSWLSRYSYVGKASQFKEVKKLIRKEADAKRYLSELEEDARAYRAALDPSFIKWKKEQAPLVWSLSALSDFRVLQSMPMLVSVLRTFFSGDLTIKQCSSVLEDLEHFHAQFTGVTSQPTGGGTARMYASSAQELSNCKDKNERAQIAKRFTAKLRERVPGEAEFSASLGEIIYTSTHTRDRSLVRYLLSKVRRKLASKADVADYDSLTIEHIYPENPEDEPQLDARILGCVGNLILVSPELNNSLANKTFAEKKAMLSKHGVELDEPLENATQWTEDQINERQLHLSKLLYQEILKV